MTEELRDAEFYCSEYASKEQPHIEGLLQGLHTGVKHLERDLAERRERHEDISEQETARRMLHRIIACSNRRNHVGFPEMVSYILGERHFICSHEFVATSFDGCFKLFMKELHQGVGLYAAKHAQASAPLEVHRCLDEPESIDTSASSTTAATGRGSYFEVKARLA